jgi:hypothetical protein
MTSTQGLGRSVLGRSQVRWQVGRPLSGPARIRRVPGRRAGNVRDAGMATAEYAIATLAACGFAGLLLVLMRSNEVRDLLLGIVRRALSVGCPARAPAAPSVPSVP